MQKSKVLIPAPQKLGNKYNVQEIGYSDLRIREDHIDNLLEGISQPATSRTLKSRNKSSYNTAWLTMMDAAIAEFFHPDRRNPDAKKEAVVQWIIEQAKKQGIANASENIAESLFTIIKPANHNPKIRRR